MSTPASIYFDLKVSNGLYASVSARKLATYTWGYEVRMPYSGNRGYQTMKGTVEWNVDDDNDSVDYMYLVHLILGDHYPKVAVAL